MIHEYIEDYEATFCVEPKSQAERAGFVRRHAVVLRYFTPLSRDAPLYVLEWIAFEVYRQHCSFAMKEPKLTC